MPWRGPLDRGHEVATSTRGVSGAPPAGVEPWLHLPLWLPAEVARTAWDVDTTRARELGLPRPGLPAGIEAALIGRAGGETDQVPPARRGSR